MSMSLVSSLPHVKQANIYTNNFVDPDVTTEFIQTNVYEMSPRAEKWNIKQF